MKEIRIVETKTRRTVFRTPDIEYLCELENMFNYEIYLYQDGKRIGRYYEEQDGFRLGGLYERN